MKNIKIIIFILVSLLLIFTLIYFLIYYKNSNINDYENNQVISTYNNPIIPDGFSKIETSTASWKLNSDKIPQGWNNGLVIQDDLGNEFVWVPIKVIDLTDILTSFSLLYDEEVTNIDTNVKEQIQKYGGFYIARYEAGIPDNMQIYLTNISGITNDITGIPVSKKDRLPWNYITLKNAKLNAQSMYNNNDGIMSDIMTVTHSLYITRWLDETGYDIYNSNTFGNFVNSTFTFTGYYSSEYDKENNYINYTYAENKKKQTYNMLLSTGASEYTNTNNIYDLAGNVIEFTDTYSYDRGYFSIGGYYSELSDKWTLQPRNIGDKTPLEKLGFRVVLYLK